MPLIVPAGIDLPLEYVTRVWYAEGPTAGTSSVVMSITAQIPDGAAVWQLVAFDARRFSPFGDTEVWLGVGNRESLPVRVTSIREDLYRHHFLQHLWLNLPAGTHTFELRQEAGGGGAILYRPHMALLLLKR